MSVGDLRDSARDTLVLYRRRAFTTKLEVRRAMWRAFDTAVRRKPLAGATRSMEIQSIFAWKSLPEAGFGKNVVIDAHRCSGSRIHLDHRSAGRSVIQDHSSDHRFKRLHLTRASVRRASGFVLTG